MENREKARKGLYENFGLRPAQRLFEGESVPDGYQCVACGYCGANNLIPVASRERYGCYFCRERLEETEEAREKA